MASFALAPLGWCKINPRLGPAGERSTWKERLKSLIPVSWVLAIFQLGYDPVWFGVIVSVTCMIGIIFPPMAVNVFVVSAVTNVPIGTVHKSCYPYMVGMSVCLLALLLPVDLALAAGRHDEVIREDPWERLQ